MKSPAKRKYAVTLPDETVATRTSAREYAFVVIVGPADDDEYGKLLARYGTDNALPGTWQWLAAQRTWGAYRWSGTRRAAEAGAREAERGFPSREVRIVTV